MNYDLDFVRSRIRRLREMAATAPDDGLRDRYARLADGCERLLQMSMETPSLAGVSNEPERPSADDPERLPA